MDISAFFTSPNFTNVPQAVDGDNAVSAQDQAHADFMDMLLAVALQNEIEDSDARESLEAQKHKLLASNNPALDNNPELDVAELLSATPDIEENIKHLTETLDLSLEEQVSLALALNQSVFDELTQPDAFSQETHQLILEKKALNEDIQAALQESEQQKVALAETLLAGLLPHVQTLGEITPLDIKNLTPEQITDLQTQLKLQDVDTELDLNNTPTDSASLNSAVLQLLDIVRLANKIGTNPPSALPAFVARADVYPQQDMALLAQHLNNIDVGGADTFSVQDDGLSEFDLLLKDLLSKGKNGETADILTQLKALQSGKAEAASVALPLPAGLPVNTDLVTASNFMSFEQYIDSLTGAQPSLNALPSTGHAITQGQSAGQSQPATQLVAITMHKMAADGQNRSVTIQLDPPELGRVEVKMNFGKDNAMKALLTIEKPETYAMLQRDAQSLERTMESLGLNADGNLSFELAQDGHGFNQDGRHDGARNKSSSGESSDAPDDLELIESTMTWQVDPETGHVRYSIWA